MQVAPCSLGVKTDIFSPDQFPRKMDSVLIDISLKSGDNLNHITTAAQRGVGIVVLSGLSRRQQKIVRRASTYVPVMVVEPYADVAHEAAKLLKEIPRLPGIYPFRRR